MKNLLLSDPNCLNNFNEIISEDFNNKSLMEQPRYLIHVDCKEGFLLRHAFAFIKSQTYRGKRLSDFPLEVIALVKDEEEIEEIRKNLSGIPNEIFKIDNFKNDSIQKLLKNKDLNGPSQSLFLTTFSNEAELYESDYGTIAFDHFPEGGAQTLLVNAAKKGWFPKVGESYRYPKTEGRTEITLNHFENRDYTIREADVKDIPKLLELEQMCWPKPLQASEERLKKRMELNPTGQLVIVTQEGVQAVIYSQNIQNIDPIFEKNATTIQDLNDPKGSIVHIRSLNVSSDQRKQSYGGHLLEFMLQKVALNEHISLVAGVTRCSNYPGKETISMEAYIRERGKRGLLTDPVLRMHERHGAEIRAVVPNYRPEDEANDGFGVLVVYDLATRKPSRQRIKEDRLHFLETELSAKLIGEKIDEIILRMLANCGKDRNEDKRTLYSRRKTLLKMGLDPMQLLELRSNLSQELAYDLYPTFFDEYSYPEAIIDYFIEKKLLVYKDWVYETQWQSSSIPEPKSMSPEKKWIVFADKGEDIAPIIKEKLHEHCQHCIVIEAGKGYKKLGDFQYTIDPLSPKDLKEVLLDIQDLSQLEGVIYLFGYEGRFGRDVAKEEFVDPSLEELEAFHKNSLGGLITVVNELAQLNLSNYPKLRVVTQTIPSDGTIASLGEWPQSSLCKVIQEEYPELQCRYIAIDSQVSFTESCDALFRELRSHSPEPLVALRKGERLVPRMVRSEIELVRLPKFVQNGSYIIAGGLRPLGLLLAQWYASHGAKSLILLDDLKVTPSIEITLHQLKRKGVDVNAYSVNIDDYSALKEIIDQISKQLPPVKGVVHAAGVVDNELIMHMDWDRFKPVHRLKVSGSWNLHCLTQNFDLDHFILFSSCLPNLAPLGKANHATGNGFLDVLAHYRKSRGLPALTIDWGPWEMRHVEVRQVVENSFTNRVDMLEVEEAFQLLEQLFYIDKAQITAAVVKWSELLLSFAGENRLFDEIAIELGFKRIDILRKYLTTKEEERIDLVQAYVHEQVRRILKLKSSYQIESERDFKKLGMDPRQMTNLKNRIQFDVEEAFKLPFNFVEAHPSIKDLSRSLSQKIGESTEKASAMLTDLKKKNIAYIKIKKEASSETLSEEINQARKKPEVDTIIIQFEK